MLVALTPDQWEAVAGVIMRVPGLFIIDYWWQHDINNSIPYTLDGMEILNSAIKNLVLLHGFLLLLLPLTHVKSLYTHFISIVMIVCSHLLSKYYVSTEGSPPFGIRAGENISLKRQFDILIFHGVSAVSVSYLLHEPWNLAALGCYILPVIAHLAHLPLHTLQVFHNFASAVMAFNVLGYMICQLHNVIDFAKRAYNDVVELADAYGIIAVLTALWNKLFVPNHFAVFWLIEFIVKFAQVMYQQSETSTSWGDEWYVIILTTVSAICASPVTLLATSVTVSYLSFFILSGTQAFLQGRMAFYQDNPMHSGWTEGLSLILLAIQTGLAEMKMPARVAAMTIILFVVLSCLLQSMLEIAEPIVLSLSASRSLNYGRHVRALILCIGLLTFPLYLTSILSQVFPIDFWMMVVLSSCMLTSIQVVDLLIVHGLFMYDSMKSDTWESLDDIVYYTRAITKILEFFIALFVVGMGLWESTTVKWNWVNGSILVVHCYFNVWQRLKTGWQSFLLRREAAQKSEALISANEEQLEHLDDVCSICFAVMKSACITPCQHFFHRTCLRKWLYVQDRCPLCHSIVSTMVSMEPKSEVPDGPQLQDPPEERRFEPRQLRPRVPRNYRE